MPRSLHLRRRCTLVRPLRRRALVACAPTISARSRSRRSIERNAERRLGRASTTSIYGCANQAGEDNRNVAPHGARCSPGCRRRCRARRSTACAGRAWTRSASRARAIKSGEAALMIAGGVESMSRAPFVMAKADSAFSRAREDRGHDDRLALRQPADEGEVRRRLDARDGGERRRASSRSRAPTRTRSRCAASSARRGAIAAGRLAEEIVPVTIPQKKGDPVVFDQDEHPRDDDARGARQAEGRGASPTAR